MGEALEDVAETEENMSEGNSREGALEGRLNAKTGYVSESVDGNQAAGDYEENKPQVRGRIKRNIRQTASKNSLPKSELEEKVSKSAIRAQEFGVDETEYRSFVLAQGPIFYSEKESEQGKDTINGVLAFIYHYNQETGELEILFEQVRPDYEPKKDRGKMKLFGGNLKTTDKSSIDGFIREIEEEFEEPVAPIINKALINNGRRYKRVYYTANGQLGYTDFLVIEIEPRNEWKIVKNARTKHDAGMPRVFTGTITGKLADDYFAFGYGPLIKELTIQELSPRNSLHYIEFKSFNYNDSFIPISHYFY